MAAPALTTTFTPAPDCTQVHLKGCGVLPYTTQDGTTQSACTGAPFPTQECAQPNASCFPSSSDNGEPIVTYAGTICPVGMEALESGSDGIFCCASGYERFGDSYCTGTATEGTFVAHSTGEAECPITSTVEFAPDATGFFDFEYSTAGSTVTLPYDLGRMQFEVTAQGIWLVPGDGSGGGDGSTSTPPPTTTSTTPTTTPTGTTDSSSTYPTDSPSSGYPTSPAPTDSPSGGSMTPVPTEGGSSYTAVPPGSSTDGGEYPTDEPTDEPTGTGYPTDTPPEGTPSPSSPVGSSTPSPSPPSAAGRMDTSLVTMGGLLFATLGYFILQ